MLILANLRVCLLLYSYVLFQVAHQRFLCALKAHFEYQKALLMRIKSAGVLPGILIPVRNGEEKLLPP